MPHRRRVPPALFKQMKNYGYVRTLANSRWPELRSWSHLAIAMFPLLFFSAIMSIACNFIISQSSELYLQIPVILAITYLSICWLGAILGNSPHKNITTLFLSPLMIFCAHFYYGIGVVKGLFQIQFGAGAAAGLGIQLDDKKRK